MCNKNEILDMVDNDDNVITSKNRKDIELEKEKNIRSVNMLICNEKRELWIPKRANNKKYYPLCLDFSAGGYVKSGESYSQAITREVKEELNINLEDHQFEITGYYSPYKHFVSCFMTVYIMRSNLVPHYNKLDFISYDWYEPENIVDMFAMGV